MNATKVPMPLCPVRDWLPAGKRAAVCLTVDDVHPGRSDQHYDGGGDLGRGALGLVRELLERQPLLKVTLFVTADWREISPAVPRTLMAGIPWLRDRLYLTDILPEGARRLDRHPDFLEYLREMPRTEIGLHGLHHVHPGPRIHVEFQDEAPGSTELTLRKMLAIFDDASIPYVRGMCPPGWNAPATLLRTMDSLGFEFVASARDIRSPISPEATSSMSGLHGVSLILPTRVGNRELVHFTSNFQATSRLERAVEIIDAGGLLAVKAHMIKDAMGHVALDGVDRSYCDYLDQVFSELHRRYGDSLWWTTMGEVARHLRTRGVASTGRAPYFESTYGATG